MTAGVMTAAAAVAFVLSANGSAAGALERLALWPVLVGLAAFAWTQLPVGRRQPAAEGAAGRTEGT